MSIIFALRRMARLLRSFVLLCAILLGACAEKQEPYPDLVTEFADIHTDANGLFQSMTTDDGAIFGITNTNIKPHHPNAIYRAVVGFVPKISGGSSEAEIYTLTGAYVLEDSTTIVRHDPTGIESMWKKGAYINMQLTAKTQGGTHLWGYAIDSIQGTGENGRVHSHFHLSIHHNQGNDPLSYSQTYYCSIPISKIEAYKPNDTVSVSVHTFDGIKKWMFSK